MKRHSVLLLQCSCWPVWQSSLHTAHIILRASWQLTYLELFTHIKIALRFWLRMFVYAVGVRRERGEQDDQHKPGCGVRA